MNTEKTEWLSELAEFIVEANQNTWAADGARAEPERPGHKELEYQKGLWRYRDSYTGYFKAPGMTTVYYKDTPAWAQCFGGPGMRKDCYGLVKPTFDFLKEALMKVTSDLPFRGPEIYHRDEDDNGWLYAFELKGNIEDCTWTEHISEHTGAFRRRVFTQTGFAGTIVHRTPDREPRYPWNL